MYCKPQLWVRPTITSQETPGDGVGVAIGGIWVAVAGKGVEVGGTGVDAAVAAAVEVGVGAIAAVVAVEPSP